MSADFRPRLEEAIRPWANKAPTASELASVIEAVVDEIVDRLRESHQ